MRRNEPTPEEREIEEMKQAARVIKGNLRPQDGGRRLFILPVLRYVPHGTLHMGGMTMTERERLLEKIRKVQALANRGADGEKAVSRRPA